MKHKNEQRTKMTLKAGGYSLTVCVIVVAIVIVLNVLVGLLPSNISKPDISSIQLYDFTDQTRSVAEKLDTDITVYFWTSDADSSSSVTISEFLDRFSALSDRITVKVKSPDREPTFAAKYVDDGEELSDNSLIFESEKRFRIVEYTDMYSWSDNALQSVYYLIYYSGYSVDQAMSAVPYDVFSAENAVVNAIDYVTTDVLPVVYVLEGHGESELGTYAQKYATDENYSVVTMGEGNSLISMEAVPEDANCVIINKPTSDISEDEYNKLMSYMAKGGTIMLFTDYYYDDDACPYLSQLCEANGLAKVDGLVLETSGYYSGYPYTLIANKVSHTITDPLIEDGSYVYCPLAHGIKTIDSYRSSLEISKLLVTSEGAYSKLITDQTSTYEKEENDVAGPFMLGVLVEEEVSEGTNSRFFWYSSEMLDDSYVAYGNGMDVFLNSLAYGTERTDTITIRSITMSNDTLDMSSATGTAWMVVLVITVPVLLIMIGFAVWFLRRGRK